MQPAREPASARGRGQPGHVGAQADVSAAGGGRSRQAGGSTRRRAGGAGSRVGEPASAEPALERPGCGDGRGRTGATRQGRRRRGGWRGSREPGPAGGAEQPAMVGGGRASGADRRAEEPARAEPAGRVAGKSGGWVVRRRREASRRWPRAWRSRAAGGRRAGGSRPTGEWSGKPARERAGADQSGDMARLGGGGRGRARARGGRLGAARRRDGEAAGELAWVRGRRRPGTVEQPRGPTPGAGVAQRGARLRD